MKHCFFLLLSFLTVAISAAEFTGKHDVLPEKTLQIIQIHQGRIVGDTYIIRLPDQRIIMIDTGDIDNAEKNLIPALDRHGIREIDTLMITHFHSDHIGGVPAMIADPALRIKQIMYTSVPENEIHGTTSRSLYKQTIRLAEKYGIALKKLEVGDKLDFGSGVSAVVSGAALPGSKDRNLNSHSLVFQLKYGDFTALFTGDCSLQQEPRILAGGIPLKSDLLKVAHHAGANSTSDRFLDTVAPAAAIACMPSWLSADPRGKRVEKMINARKIPFFRSWEYPDATVFSDGKTFGIYVK